MTKHGTHRWFQFGILDVLILTAVVGIGVGLCRPVPARTCAGRPWIFVAWRRDFDEQLVLLPDGAYAYYPRSGPGYSIELCVGAGWKVITPRAQPDGAFCLRCGEKLSVVRLVESGDRVMELLNGDGRVHSKLRQLWQLVCGMDSSFRSTVDRQVAGRVPLQRLYLRGKYPPPPTTE